MSAHTCHAFDCDTPVPPRMFMCRPHWFALPLEMRDAVNREYTPGQERDLSKVTPVYLSAVRAARLWLRDKPKTMNDYMDEILCRAPRVSGDQ